MRTYHDVIVYIDEKSYRIADNYAWQLICSKIGGWQLWQNFEDLEELIGGEYDSNNFRIEVAGEVICNNRRSKTWLM